MTQEPLSRVEPAQEGRVRVQLPLYTARWTPILIVINVAIFIIMSLVNVLATPDGLIGTVIGGSSIRTLVVFGAKVNDLILAGEYWRFFTPIFLHIGIIHLLFNMFALRIFGEQVERFFGPTRFLSLYLISGLFGSLASFAFTPQVSAGASGAIFGVIGAFTAFFFRNRETFGEVAEQQLRSMGGLILINLLLGVTVPGIDNFGHLGGLFAGLLLGLLMSPTYTVQQQPFAPPSAVEEEPPLSTLITTVGGLVLFAIGVLLAMPIAPTLLN